MMTAADRKWIDDVVRDVTEPEVVNGVGKGMQ